MLHPITGRFLHYAPEIHRCSGRNDRSALIKDAARNYPNQTNAHYCAARGKVQDLVEFTRGVRGILPESGLGRPAPCALNLVHRPNPAREAEVSRYVSPFPQSSFSPHFFHTKRSDLSDFTCTLNFRYTRMPMQDSQN